MNETVLPEIVQSPLSSGLIENVTGNPDEVLLDLGMYSQVIGPAGPEPVELTHRLIMNFVTAKKLAEVLRVVVARHEQAFGVIDALVRRGWKDRVTLETEPDLDAVRGDPRFAELLAKLPRPGK